MNWSANPERTLALAALLQAGELVVQLAQKDQFDDKALLALADSVLALEETEASAIYGGVAKLDLGLNIVHTLLRATPTPAHKELIRYSVSMAQLSQRLMQSSAMQASISTGIYSLQNEFDEEAMHGSDAFYIGIAKLYQTSLSQLEPKIMVRGAQGQLEAAETVARVRVALFAGVRAAYLWHQLGGRRWHLMLARKSYVAEAQRLLAA